MIRYTSKWMCVVRDNIEDHTGGEKLLGPVYSTTEFTSKRICVAGDSVEYYIQIWITFKKSPFKKYRSLRSGFWALVAMLKITSNMILLIRSLYNNWVYFEVNAYNSWQYRILHEKWTIFKKNLFINYIHFEMNVCSISQYWRSHQKWKAFSRVSFISLTDFEVNVCKSWQLWTTG